MKNPITRILLFFYFFLVSCTGLLSHPSWGIIVDSLENIYFVDVLHNGDGSLWKIHADHQKIEAVQTYFHAHDIQMDHQGRVWAAIAIWRSGEIEEEGHNYLFQYHPETNQLDTILFTEDWDEFHGSVFAVSPDIDQVYFTMDNKLLAKPLDGGAAYPVIDHEFGRLNTMVIGPNGKLWITDKRQANGTLYQWSEQDGLTVFAQNLFPQIPANPIFEEVRHQLFYGIGFSFEGHPILSDNAERRLVEILGPKETRTVFQSEEKWHPSGIFTHNGKYYMLETGWEDGQGHLGPRVNILDDQFRLLERLEIDYRTQMIIKTKETDPKKELEEEKSRGGGFQAYLLLIPLVVMLYIFLLGRKKISTE